MREDGWISQQSKDPVEPQTLGEIQLALDPVLEAQVEPVAAQRLDLYDILQDHVILIFFQLGPMRCRPLDYQAQSPWRQHASQHRTPLNVQYSPVLTIPHVEMRRRMIVVVHRYDDTKESADLGHGRNRLASAVKIRYRSAARRRIFLRAMPRCGKCT